MRAPQARRWLHYGASLGGYLDITGQQRVVGLVLSTEFADPLGPDEVKGARERLGWAAPAFSVPADARDLWRSAGRAGQAARQAWKDRLAALPALQSGRAAQGTER